MAVPFMKLQGNPTSEQTLRSEIWIAFPVQYHSASEALAWAGDRTVSRPGSNPATVTSLRNFGNSVYRALPVSFGGDTKSRRSLLSGVYARGSKRSHQSALECVTVVDSTTHSKLPDPQSAIMRRKTLPCTCIGRRRRRRSHVVLFDMNMCYLTWAGLAAAHTNLHEENLHHFVDDS